MLSDEYSEEYLKYEAPLTLAQILAMSDEQINQECEIGYEVEPVYEDKKDKPTRVKVGGSRKKAGESQPKKNKQSVEADYIKTPFQESNPANKDQPFGLIIASKYISEEQLDSYWQMVRNENITRIYSLCEINTDFKYYP